MNVQATQATASRGAALLIALIVLMLITILGVSGVRLSIGGLRGAVNEELRVDAFHRAQSLVDGTLSIPANTAVVGVVDQLNCLPSMSGCARNDLTLPDMSSGDFEDGDSFDQAYTDLVNSGVQVAVQRLAPEQAPPPRTAGFSAVKFHAAAMEVQSRYDETSHGYGRANLDEGVVVIVPMPGN